MVHKDAFRVFIQRRAQIFAPILFPCCKVVSVKEAGKAKRLFKMFGGMFFYQEIARGGQPYP